MFWYLKIRIELLFQVGEQNCTMTTIIKYMSGNFGLILMFAIGTSVFCHVATRNHQFGKLQLYRATLRTLQNIICVLCRVVEQTIRDFPWAKSQSQSNFFQFFYRHFNTRISSFSFHLNTRIFIQSIITILYACIANCLNHRDI